jgi:proline utilization trans-activator
VSTIIILVARFIDKTLLDDRVPWLNKAFELLDTMINGGNRIADFRKRELHQLEEMLTEYSLMQENPPNASIDNQQSAPGLPYSDNVHCVRGLMASPGGMPLYSGFSDESSGFGDDLSAEQILAITESMDIENTDWLSFTVMDNLHTINPHII